jgi:hypothetical protein
MRRNKGSPHHPVARALAASNAALVCMDADAGFVKGNVTIVSQRAETLIEHFRKVSATPDELRLIADWMERSAARPVTAPPKTPPRTITLDVKDVREPPRLIKMVRA